MLLLVSSRLVFMLVLLSMLLIRVHLLLSMLLIALSMACLIMLFLVLWIFFSVMVQVKVLLPFLVKVLLVTCFMMTQLGILPFLVNSGINTLERIDFMKPYDLLLILVVVGVIPYFLVCRLLWYVGSWFKNHK